MLRNERFTEAFRECARKRKESRRDAAKYLAGKAGYRRYRTVYDIARGEMFPRGPKAGRLARELGGTVDFFWGECTADIDKEEQA